INHQVEILELLRRLNRESGVTVLATMHDLNLAAMYFEGLTMIKHGQVVAEGPPAAVLSAERIQQVFGAPVEIQRHPRRTDAPLVVLLPPV
ncbi:MAG: Fe(3+) dicitrate ABC transporter ATP-binding protein FecE, partial [Rudaea sp.]